VKIAAVALLYQKIDAEKKTNFVVSVIVSYDDTIDYIQIRADAEKYIRDNMPEIFDNYRLVAWDISVNNEE